MKIDKKSLFYIIPATIPWYGIELFGIGLPIIVTLLYLLLLLFTEFPTIPKKLTIWHGIIALYYIWIAISSGFSSCPKESVIELFVGLTVLGSIILINFKDCSLELLLKVLSVSSILRSSLELYLSISSLSSWQGKYLDFMRFSVTQVGGDPNNLAFLLISAIIFFYFKNGILYKIGLLIIMIHFFMLFSRGAILSLTISLLIYAIFMNFRKVAPIIITIGTLVISAIVVILSGDVNYKVSSLAGQDTSAQGRLAFWKETIDSLGFKELIFGGGPRSYVDNFGHWAHNSFVNRIYEIGLIGLIIYVCILGISYIFYFKRKHYIFIVFSSFCIASFFVDLYWNLLSWLLIGFALDHLKELPPEFITEKFYLRNERSDEFL